MAASANGRRFAISDVHGCAATFAFLLHQKLQINAGDRLYLLGDLINRGPDSKGVLKQVKQLRKSGIEVILFRGNHEAVLLEAYQTGRNKAFVSLGGASTLRSFGVDKVRDLPAKYIALIREGKYFHIEDPYIFVHAGLNFSGHDIFEDKEAMIWIKRMTIDRKKLGGRVIIHGHTPWPKTAIRKQIEQDRLPPALNIDGGCVYNGPGSRLVAFNIDSLEWTFVKNREAEYGDSWKR